MRPISFAYHPFPPDIIQHATWLYLRFILNYRDVEELLAERGLDVSYEMVRRWVLKFGPAYARNLRRSPRPVDTWRLDEMVVSIQGRRMYLWRAVDGEGEIRDVLVQPRRDKVAALTLMCKLLRKQSSAPTVLVTDKLASYGGARRELVFRLAMSRAYARTTAPRTRIKLCDDVSARCRASSQRTRPSAFSPATPRSTTCSISNAISSPVARCACSEPRRRSNGTVQPRPHE